LERPKEGLTDKTSAHATTIVGDDERSPIIPVTRFDHYPAAVSRCVTRIQEKVVDNALQLLFVCCDSGKTFKLSDPLDFVTAIKILNRLNDNRV